METFTNNGNNKLINKFLSRQKSALQPIVKYDYFVEDVERQPETNYWCTTSAKMICSCVM